MTNKIARLVDRAGIVAADCRVVRAVELEACEVKLGISSQRARVLRSGIALAALSVLLVAVLVILLF